jgi:histidine triad (HIT) family protein
MSDPATCIFCKIVAGQIPAKIVARTDHALAFLDLNPQAPTHALVIPLRHVEHLGEFVESATPEEAHDLFSLASQIGREASDTGYRVVTNEGPDAGQSVFHLHLHVLAGRALGWPPG